MKETRDKIEKLKRRVETLLDFVRAKSANYSQHPNFDKSDRLHKAEKHIQCAAHELWMGTVALLEKPDA
jgi:hypothetical protein